MAKDKQVEVNTEGAEETAAQLKELARTAAISQIAIALAEINDIAATNQWRDMSNAERLLMIYAKGSELLVHVVDLISDEDCFDELEALIADKKRFAKSGEDSQ